LLIADEPTTALDVTLQAQILDLMRELKAASGAAIILITHDLGVVAEVCDEVAVMYAGEIVERAPVDELFANPQHPYTVGLLGSIPRLDRPRLASATIEGMVSEHGQSARRLPVAGALPFRQRHLPLRAAELATVKPGHTSRCIRAPAGAAGVMTGCCPKLAPRARCNTQCAPLNRGPKFGAANSRSRFCSASLHAARRPGHETGFCAGQQNDRPARSRRTGKTFRRRSFVFGGRPPFIRAVDGVSFSVDPAKTWRWSASPLRQNPP